MFPTPGRRLYHLPLNALHVTRADQSVNLPAVCVYLAGVYAMIDDGELDWKVICIRADDPMAAKLNDVEDVERCVVSALPLCCTWV